MVNANEEFKQIQRNEANPYNQCLFHAFSKQDRMSPIVQKACILIVALFLPICLVLPHIAMSFGLDGSWDEKEGLRAFDFGGLMKSTIEMDMKLPLIVAALYLFTLTMLDLLGFGLPKSWNTKNFQCYEEMFSEPMRTGHLIRRPGNTLSNVLYVVGGVIFAHSCIWGEVKNVFRTADFIFAIMLFILSMASTTWHGSNVPTSHYIDLWSMNACILYLLIRNLSVAVYVLLKRANVESDVAELIASLCCTISFLLYIVIEGNLWISRCQKGVLHGGVPFSIRARLKSKTRKEISLVGLIFAAEIAKEFPPPRIVELCAFGAMPIIFQIPSILVSYYIFGTLGSVSLLMWAYVSLTIGWTYRLWERWLLDGCAPMKTFTDQMSMKNSTHSGLLTIGAALTSPTAILHIFTGISLLAGYMHVRSLDLIIIGT